MLYEVQILEESKGWVWFGAGDAENAMTAAEEQAATGAQVRIVEPQSGRVLMHVEPGNGATAQGRLQGERSFAHTKPMLAGVGIGAQVVTK